MKAAWQKLRPLLSPLSTNILTWCQRRLTAVFQALYVGPLNLVGSVSEDCQYL